MFIKVKLQTQWIGCGFTGESIKQFIELVPEKFWLHRCFVAIYLRILIVVRLKLILGEHHKDWHSLMVRGDVYFTHKWVLCCAECHTKFTESFN